MKVPNLGEFKVLTLRDTPIELAHHTIETPEHAADYWRTHIPKDPRHNPEVECFYVLCLSVRKKPLGYSIVSTGTLDTILVHPREVFRPAIIAAAACIVLFHNHPSGDATPSEADIKVTRDLIRGGSLLKLEVMDHLIMGRAENGATKDYTSLRELGYFYA
jgi:DNA repair protein RadC